MIALHCPCCRETFRAPEDQAGKAVRCPECGLTVLVPSFVPPCREDGLGETVELPPEAVPASVTEQEKETPLTGASDHGDRQTGRGPPDDLCAFLAPAQGPGEVGRLAHYRVLEVLAVGGMGVVYKAEDTLLRRLVALKAILPRLASRPALRRRFFREARAAAAVEHDHVVAIYQVGEDHGVAFLVMPLLRGESLEDRLQRERRLPLPVAVRVGIETAEALAAAHAAGLIHGDVKPANIWLEGEPGASATGWRVKVLDFGLAVAVGQQADVGAIFGTPNCMAPEQALGLVVDHRCDLFSLGVVLYRLTTGEQPFKGQGPVRLLRALTTRRPRPPRQVNAEVPEALSALVEELLAKGPESRPASARKVADALRAILAEITAAGVEADRPPPLLIAPRGRGLAKGALAAGYGALLLLAGLAAGWALGRAGEQRPSGRPDADAPARAVEPPEKGKGETPARAPWEE